MRQAASVLLLRNHPGGGVAVLMIRRAERGGDFRSGAAVFPGGVVDLLDRQAHPLVDGWDDADLSARLGVESGGLDYLVAAARECFEEVGVWCAAGDEAVQREAHGRWRAPLQEGRASLAEACQALGVRLPVASWAYLAHWVTPPGMPRRFDTRFFIAPAPEGQEPVADEGEAQEAFWCTPAEALAPGGASPRPMVLLPVTRALLEWLAPHRSVEEAVAAAGRQANIPCIMPRLARVGAGERARGTVLLPGAPAYAEVARLDPDGAGQVSAELVYGSAVAFSARVWRVTAPNSGKMTGAGTNSYLVGDPAVNRWTVVDPGPDDPGHRAALQAAAPGPIERILLTHTHPDHAEGAAALAIATGAPIWAMRPAAVLSDTDIPYKELFGGEQIVLGPDATLTVLHTPGHASDHLAFVLEEEQLLLAGDLVMQGGTVVIDPPDGDLGVYLRTLEGLADRALTWVAPGHGFLLGDPPQLFRHVIRHRMAREAKVIAALQQQQSATVESLVPVVYQEVPPELHPLAARSLLAHLLHLQHAGAAHGANGRWRLTR